jgi:hypothetical protein
MAGVEWASVIVRGVHIRHVGSVYWADSRLPAGWRHHRATVTWMRETELPLPERPIVLAIVSSGSAAPVRLLELRTYDLHLMPTSAVLER